MPLHFYERLPLVAVSLAERNPRRIFSFMKKKGKEQKQGSAFVLQPAAGSVRPGSESCKGVMLSVKLDIIKHIWYEQLGYFLDLGPLKIFSTLMITASSLYTISTYERFHRNAPLLVSRENLYMKTDRTGTFLIWFSGLILFELLSFIF